MAHWGQIQRLRSGYWLGLVAVGFTAAITSVYAAKDAATPCFCREDGSAFGVARWSESANNTFLDNQSIGQSEPWDTSVWDDRFLDKGARKDIEIKYGQIAREQTEKENYGIQTHSWFQSYAKRVSGFTMYVLRSVLSFKIHDGVKQAEKNSSEVRTFRQVHESVGSMARGDLSLVDSSTLKFKFGARTDLPKQRSSLWMKSDLVDSSFDMAYGKPWAFDPWTFENLNQDFADERYTVSVSRAVPLLDLKSSVTYGGSSSHLTYAISREVFRNFNAEVSASRGFESATSFRSPEEEKFKIYYGTQF